MAAAARRKGGPLQQLVEALRSTLCFCFPSALDQEDQDEEAEDDATGERRRRRRGEGGGGGSSRASAPGGGGPSRSPGSATSSAAGSAASAGGGSAGSDLLFLPPAPPPAPPFEGPPVIGPRSPSDAAAARKTLVLDLDETLVHSSFRPVPNADFVIPVEIDGRCVDVYVLKRPHVDEFLAQVGPRFEVVVFTASLAKYADPLLDLLDARTNAFKWRLFRDACVAFEGNYVKDLQCLGRPLQDSIIVDNSPHSYVFQPDNAVPVSTFIDDPADTELLQILPLLLAVERVPDVRPHLAHHVARLAEAQASRIGRGGG